MAEPARAAPRREHRGYRQHGQPAARPRRSARSWRHRNTVRRRRFLKLQSLEQQPLRYLCCREPGFCLGGQDAELDGVEGDGPRPVFERPNRRRRRLNLWLIWGGLSPASIRASGNARESQTPVANGKVASGGPGQGGRVKRVAKGRGCGAQLKFGIAAPPFEHFFQEIVPLNYLDLTSWSVVNDPKLLLITLPAFCEHEPRPWRATLEPLKSRTHHAYRPLDERRTGP